MRIFFFLLLSGVAFAQDLSCASLLEALPNTRFNQLTSFEAVFSFRESDETITVRQIEDVTGERSYYESDDGTGNITIARYEGNNGIIERNGQSEIAPPEEGNELLGFFDVFLSQTIFREAELVSCDGVQTLETPEDAITGEALSLNIMGDPGRLFFDENGHTVAFSSGDEVGVFSNTYKDDLLVKSELNIYSLETQEVVRTMTFELVSFDQTVDASLFGDKLECEGLLDVFKNQPEFSSLETTTTYANQPDAGADYKVVDFTNRRVYWEITAAGVKTIFRLVNGEVTGETEDGETADVPESIRFSLESTFEAAAASRDLAQKAVVLSCDGEQSYSDASGEIVRGQQVIVADKTNPGSDSTKLLFDEMGNFIGNYVDRPEGEQDFLLVNSGLKKDDAGVVIEVTNATYVQEGEVFEPLSKTTTKTLSYNQLVDESLFKP